MSFEEGVYLDGLYGEYSSLITENKRGIFEMYYKYDLSLGEIAEIKGISRQSVQDSLSSTKKQLLSYEKKLGYYGKKNKVYRLIDGLSEENKQIGESIKSVLGDN